MFKFLNLLSLGVLLINTSVGFASDPGKDPFEEKPRSHPYDPTIEDVFYMTPSMAGPTGASSTPSGGFSAMMEAFVNMFPGARHNTALQTTIADQQERIRVLEQQLEEKKQKTLKAELLKQKTQEERSTILLTVQKGEAAAILQKVREEELIRVIAEKDQIISELEKANTELRREKSDRDELEIMLKVELQKLAGSGAEDSAKTQQLRSLITKAKENVLSLENKTKMLEAQKIDAENKAQQLQKAIEINDHYAQIKSRI